MRRKQLARRKMARVMDELYTTLFMAGAQKVDMSLERLEGLVTPRTKGLLLNSPNNPNNPSNHQVETIMMMKESGEQTKEIGVPDHLSPLQVEMVGLEHNNQSNIVVISRTEIMPHV